MARNIEMVKYISPSDRRVYSSRGNLVLNFLQEK